MTAPLHALHAKLGGQVVNAHGDAQLLIGSDLVYCGLRSTVRVDHGGHILTLGSMHDPVDMLAEAFMAATERVVA